MLRFCILPYSFLIVVAAIAFCLGLVLRQQRNLRRKKNPGFDHQTRQIMLAMFVLSLLGAAIFVVYIVSPQTGC
jgi:hypothetical protein